MRRPLRIFVSYAHADEAFRQELAKHLALLVRQGIVERWDDRCIRPGDEWKTQIDERIQQADLILLLVSADFLASDYCYDIEVKHALARHNAGQARVIPVILRPVHWKSAPFAKLQALPRDGNALAARNDTDSAWADVAETIAQAAEQAFSKPPDATVGFRSQSGTDAQHRPCPNCQSIVFRYAMGWVSTLVTIVLFWRIAKVINQAVVEDVPLAPPLVCKHCQSIVLECPHCGTMQIVDDLPPPGSLLSCNACKLGFGVCEVNDRWNAFVADGAQKN